ncbi:MAG: FG-GAP-like repeat-containing protein [Planctomycetota bacterium]
MQFRILVALTIIVSMGAPCRAGDDFLTRTETVEVALSGQTFVDAIASMPGFDSVNGTRQLLRVDVEVTATAVAQIQETFIFFEGPGGLAPTVATWQGSIDTEISSATVSCPAVSETVPLVCTQGSFLTANFEVRCDLATGTIDEPLDLLVFIDGAPDVRIIPDAFVEIMLDESGIPLQAGFVCWENVAATWSAVVRLRYTYRDTLVQPWVQRQSISLRAAELGGEGATIELLPFDDLNGTRQLLSVDFDHTYGFDQSLQLFNSSGAATGTVTVDADWSMPLTNDVITLPWNANQSALYPSFGVGFFATTMGSSVLFEPQYEMRDVASIRDSSFLAAMQNGLPVTFDVVPSQSTTIQPLGVIGIPMSSPSYFSELTIDAIYTETVPPIGAPDFSVLFDVPTLQASGELGGVSNSTTGLPFDDVVVAVDLDGAKTQDVLSVYVNNGLDQDGTSAGFTLTQVIPIGFTPTALLTGDLNDDSAVDIAAATADDDTVWVVLNDGSGTGTFLPAAPVLLSRGDGPVGLALFDANEDGLNDLAAANAGSNTVRAILNDIEGPGSFFVGASTVADDPTDICPTDVDEDKDIDLIVLSVANETVTVIEVEAGGLTPTTTLATGPSPTAAIATDLNLDGNGDVLVTNAIGNTLQYFQNDAQGGFDAPSLVLIESGVPTALASGDFDGDGDDDIAVVASDAMAGDRVDVYETDFEGSTVVLRPPFTAGVINNGSSLITGDFNADAIEDLAVFDASAGGGGGAHGPSSEGELAVFAGQRDEVMCFGDVAPAGGNGEVNIDDVIEVIVSFGACIQGVPCPADITPPGGNGTVNVDDLIAVIVAFGTCTANGV